MSQPNEIIHVKSFRGMDGILLENEINNYISKLQDKPYNGKVAFVSNIAYHIQTTSTTVVHFALVSVSERPYIG